MKNADNNKRQQAQEDCCAPCISGDEPTKREARLEKKGLEKGQKGQKKGRRRKESNPCAWGKKDSIHNQVERSIL